MFININPTTLQTLETLKPEPPEVPHSSLCCWPPVLLRRQCFPWRRFFGASSSRLLLIVLGVEGLGYYFLELHSQVGHDLRGIGHLITTPSRVHQEEASGLFRVWRLGFRGDLCIKASKDFRDAKAVRDLSASRGFCSGFRVEGLGFRDIGTSPLVWCRPSLQPTSVARG